jgi:hypothetical protein
MPQGTLALLPLAFCECRDYGEARSPKHLSGGKVGGRNRRTTKTSYIFTVTKSQRFVKQNFGMARK